MNNFSSRRSSLFLLELIFAILFFCLAAAVCVQLFVKSYTLSQDTKELTFAVNEATSVAEILRNTSDPLVLLKAEYSNGEFSEYSYSLYYDKDWISCTQANAAYSIIVENTWDSENNSRHYALSVFSSDSDTSIYALNIKKHLASTLE